VSNIFDKLTSMENILVCRRLRGFNYSEISRQLNMPKSTTRNRCIKAMSKIKKLEREFAENLMKDGK